MDVLKKYEILRDRVSSPKSINPFKTTIFSFQRYCRHCNTGMFRPRPHQGKKAYLLFRSGYCSNKCREFGPREIKNTIKIKETRSPSTTLTHQTEEMALLSLKVARELTTTKMLVKIVREAHRMFRLLSEKLSYVESMTGRKWYPSKFYFWLNK